MGKDIRELMPALVIATAGLAGVALMKFRKSGSPESPEDIDMRITDLAYSPEAARDPGQDVTFHPVIKNFSAVTVEVFIFITVGGDLWTEVGNTIEMLPGMEYTSDLLSIVPVDAPAGIYDVRVDVYCNMPQADLPVPIAHKVWKKGFTVNDTMPSLEYELNVSHEGEGVTTPASRALPYMYDADQNVVLDAVPAAGNVFVEWVIDGVQEIATPAFSLAMNRNHTAHAVFELEETPASHSVQLAISGTGAIWPDPGTYSVEEGVLFTCTATETATGWAFDYWQNNITGVKTYNNSIEVFVDGPQSFTAIFAQTIQQWTLAVGVQYGNGSTNPAGSSIHNDGELVTISPIPAAGWSFAKWYFEDGGTSSVAEINVVMDRNRSAYAQFIEDSLHALTIEVFPGHEAGTTQPPSGQYNWPASQYTLQAFPNAGWHFSHWQKNGLPQEYYPNPYYLSLVDNTAMMAFFESDQPAGNTVAEQLASCWSYIEGGGVRGDHVIWVWRDSISRHLYYDSWDSAGSDLEEILAGDWVKLYLTWGCVLSYAGRSWSLQAGWNEILW